MKRVLVIEDQKPVRDSIGEILELAGCSVHLIGDGQAALNDLLEAKYDLITLDLNMPSLDGVSMLETLVTQDGPNSTTPVIVVSAYLSPATIDAIGQLGVQHHLSKPFEAEALLEPVRKLLQLG